MIFWLTTILNVKQYSFPMSLLKYDVSAERNTLVFYQLRMQWNLRTDLDHRTTWFYCGHTTLLTQVQVMTHVELTILVLEVGLLLRCSSPYCTGVKTLLYLLYIVYIPKPTIIFFLYRFYVLQKQLPCLLGIFGFIQLQFWIFWLPSFPWGILL